MASEVFLDANLFIDLTLRRAGFTTANAVIQKGIERNNLHYINSMLYEQLA